MKALLTQLPSEAVADAAVKDLQAAVPGLPAVLAQVLARRGYTPATLPAYFDPQPEHLHSPALLEGMAIATARLQAALERKEKVCLLGDYDADGICATALMALGLESLGAAYITYTPDRFTEGYGLSEQAVEKAAQEGCKLLITLDCGTKNLDTIALAKAKGIETIVADHHLPGDALPVAVAVLNPQRKGSGYPYAGLTGCGVALKLWQSLCEALGLPQARWMAMLDLVAIATCADAAPLDGENRSLVKLGLSALAHTTRPGLRALLEIAGCQAAADGSYSLDAHRLVFTLAPRLNAAGRMAHGSLAVRLLTARSQEEAEALAAELEQCNNQRREADQLTTNQALERIAALKDADRRPSTVLYSPTWPMGVLGITASRLLERYPRPTVVLAGGADGLVTGSARSVPGFDLYQALTACEDLLTRFGGHAFAAGLTLPIERLQAFEERFSALAEAAQAKTEARPASAPVAIDGDLRFEQITPELCHWAMRMAPFGPANPAPVFATRNLLLLEDSRVLSAKYSGQPAHLLLSLAEAQGGRVMQAVGWNKASQWEEITRPPALAITYTLELHGRQPRPRMVLKNVGV